jgi:hypothetical protein
MFILNLKFLCLIIGITLYTYPAYAYLDPGTGSMLLQGLIGGLAMIISVLSIYWQKVKSFFVKKELDTDVDVNVDVDVDVDVENKD